MTVWTILGCFYIFQKIIIKSSDSLCNADGLSIVKPFQILFLEHL